MSTAEHTGADALRLGTLQAAAQSGCFGLLMFISSDNLIAFDDSPTLIRTEAFGPVLLGVVVTLCALGVAIDLRRWAAPLALLAPPKLRYGIAAFALLSPIVYAAVQGVPLLFAYACVGFTVCPYLFVTLDRLLGPAWVLGRAAACARARRRWSLHRVLEAGEARAVVEDSDGRRLTVRTEVSLEPGPAYLLLGPRRPLSEPYRTNDVDAVLYDAESAETRAVRRRDLGTAALALLSGLAWVGIPFAVVLGEALTDCIPPSEYPNLCG